MKSSNKIIISFAAFVLAGMIILFADAKQHNEVAQDNFIFKEFKLPAFTVVVTENGADLHLDKSDKRMIKVEYIKNKPTPAKIYELKNDTLFVYGGLRTFVECPDVKAIVGNKPYWVGVNNFSPDTMTIKMNGGRLFCNPQRNTGNQTLINQMSMGIIVNEHAFVEINNNVFQNITVKSKKSEVKLHCSAKNSIVKLENNSKISHFGNFENLTVTKDSTSICEFFSNIMRH